MANPNKKLNEMDEMLYVISHDFNAPLRHIREFTNLLIKKIDDGRLQNLEKVYAGYIEESVREAEAMLMGLLRYSRLNTKREEPVKFNIKELMSYIIEENKTDLKKAGGTINLNCKDNLEIKADKKQIEILISELLSNAIKFCSHKKPKIDIDIKQQNKELIFSIKDNGIGNIPENLQDEIFHVYRRLNRKEDYSGLGMGLTLAKKVVELHKGKIWLESSDNQGSEFKFTLPIAPQK